MIDQSFFDFEHSNVYGVYGHLGGGKTLTAVSIMIEALKLGHGVTTNIALKLPDKLQARYNFIDDFSKTDFGSLSWGAPRGSPSKYRHLICIDEAAEFLDQYSSSSKFTQDFLSWLRHSSKRGQIVLLVIQRPEFLVKSARLLVNRWILCDDMSQFRTPFLKIRTFWLSAYCRRILIDRLGNVISRGMNLIKKAEYGKYYDTSQIIGHFSANPGELPDMPKSDYSFLIWFFAFV